MKRLLWMASIVLGSLHAQSAPESLSSWLYFKDLQSVPQRQGFASLLLDRDVLDKARNDEADVRLYSGSHEVPYALRIRHEVEQSEAFPAREFNRGTAGGSAEISLDLGEQPQQHNEVEIDTAGDNFRRMADVEGSPDGVQWSKLSSQAIVFRFTASGRTVEQQAIPYPVSRYRYLRIRVSRDSQTDKDVPEIKSVRIRRVVEAIGEDIPFQGTLEVRDADRVNGRPASIWRIDFGGRIPIHRIEINTYETAFSRPFQLDVIDDPSTPVFLASGELNRRADETVTPLKIEFQEHWARRVKLTITDDRNTPLSINVVNAQSAARELIFEAQAAPEPMRIYYGNPKALAPHYDIAARLPAEIRPAPSRAGLGPQHDNPIYVPEPKPFSERAPWLVYVVLAAASVALAAILVNLMRHHRLLRVPEAD
ncbi:MAG TPA: DUF3999 family protein [Bryobacteraceae bacterium]|nr:DUF3999 family protein [Bryobacteraceae bacterium]